MGGWGGILPAVGEARGVSVWARHQNVIPTCAGDLSARTNIGNKGEALRLRTVVVRGGGWVGLGGMRGGGLKRSTEAVQQWYANGRG
jgi:hypothetical protein